MPSSPDGRSGRELSPYSARRAMTLQMNEQNRRPPPREGSGRSPRRAAPAKPPRASRSRSRSRERRAAQKPSDAPRGSPASRHRNLSPEPYRRPRAVSRERRRGRERETEREGERERNRLSGGRRDRSGDSRRRRHDRRSRSPLPHRPRKHPRSRSRSRSPSRSPLKRSKKPLPDQDVSFRGLDNSTQPPSKHGGAPPNKEKPNFNPTGLLAKHANKVEGTKISLKYHEPPEARKPSPSSPWQLFIFKGDDVVDQIELSRRSCWLLGRAHEVCDVVLEHSSISGQHAVIQFRYIQKTVEDEFGVRQKKGKVKPYVIDLESSNGTELNGERIETSRYMELRDKDILKFAGSEREYVVMLPPPDS